MFFVLAMGVGVFYFMMGAMFTSIQYVCVSILKPEIISCNVDIIEPYNPLPSGIFPKCAPPGYSVLRFRRELCWVLNIKTKQRPYSTAKSARDKFRDDNYRFCEHLIMFHPLARHRLEVGTSLHLQCAAIYLSWWSHPSPHRR